MKIIISFCMLFIFFNGFLFSNVNIILKNGEDYTKKLLDNSIFLKRIRDVEYRDGFIFFLDRDYGTVFKVEFTSGKLVKTIFRKGQGPNELTMPESLKVRNNKLYVLDRGFNGVKIADTEGLAINEFKIKSGLGNTNIDLNSKDEIFIGEYNSKAQTYISVYDQEGKKLRDIVEIKEKTNKKSQLSRMHFYRIRIDKDDNIIILFNVLSELRKYNNQGKLIWVKKISNRILDEFVGTNKVTVSNKGAINTRLCIFGIEITKSNNILVSHCGGGSLFDANGSLNALITFEPRCNMGIIEHVDHTLINILVFGEYIHLYKLKEVL